MREAGRPMPPVHEDLHFQHVAWTLQRAGWIAVALIAMLALTGVFSHGFFSHTVARREGVPLTVSYERFQRMTASYRFDISTPYAAENEIRLTFSKTFSDFYEIDSIQPQPARSNSGDGEIVLEFEPAERGPFGAVVWVRPRGFGYAPLEIGTPRGALTLPVLIYP